MNMKNKLIDFKKTIEVKNSKQFYLDEILTDEDYKIMLVRNRVVVLNKTECGNGGTSSIVDYIKSPDCKRGALILVPNRSIVIGKEDKYKDTPEICCVYGGKDEINLSAKIVIATYDQYNRLLNALDSTGTMGDMFDGKFWAGRVIVVDEYHKLVDESKFRKVMTGVSDLIIRTDEPVVLMSATPHDGYVETLNDVLYEKKDIVPITISYEMTNEGDTKLDRSIAKRLKLASRKMTKAMGMYGISPHQLSNFFQGLINHEKNVCVFYNNVSAITRILKKIGTDACEILCSSDEKQKEKCGKYYSDKYNPDKRVHFMTSAYFTGHDIEDAVHACYIIGSRRASNTALSMRDIKQIIGRFREYCGDTWSGIRMMYLYEDESEDEYKSVDKQLAETEFWLGKCGGDWVNNVEAIKMKLNNLKYRDIKEQFEYWKTPKNLIERLRKEGYVVFTAKEDGKPVDRPIKIEDLPEYVSKSSLSYRVAFIKIANGEDVSWEEYMHVNKITEYITRFGITRNKRGGVVVPPREKVFAYVDISNKLDDIETDFERLSQEERFIAVGLEDCAYYKGKYLMNILKYIQECYPKLIQGELDYGILPIKFKDVFGAVMFLDKEGRTKGSDLWCVYGSYLFDKINDFINTEYFYSTDYMFSDSYTIENYYPKKCIAWSKNEINFSYMNRIQYEKQKDGSKRGRCMAKTVSFDNIEDVLEPLKGNYTYDWVNEDKKVRLYKMKMDLYDFDRLKEQIAVWKEKVDTGVGLTPVETKIYDKISGKSEYELKMWYHFIKDKQRDWFDIKNYKQLKISELYLDSDSEYRHTKSDMDMVGCLVDDIDGGFAFSEFKEMYKQYKWYAYPTISNTNTSDWNKYRVIIPLPNPVKIDGENNVRVLKALRTMFCPYEDRCHGLTSYINLDDFKNMYENDGKLFEVRQKDVDLLQHLFSVANTYTTTETYKPEVKCEDCSNSVLINGTIKMFNSCEKNWNTTIYNRLVRLVMVYGFGRNEIDLIKSGLTNREFADYMENVVIRNHPEWRL